MVVSFTRSKVLRTLAIIPARGGSKRIFRKNIRPFQGKPIIAWSIDAAIDSGVFDTVMVSTDDAEIAEIGRAAGAEVPFLRSAETADDFATTADVLLEVFSAFKDQGKSFDLACCLYPTAPFVTAEHLQDGLKRLRAKDVDVVMPVTCFDYPIWRSLSMDGDGNLSINFPDNLNARSQDLPPAYHDAGQWYWFDVRKFLASKALIGENTVGIELPTWAVQDIDTEEDWRLAELKHASIWKPAETDG